MYNIPGVYVDQVANTELTSSSADQDVKFIIGPCRNFNKIVDAQLVTGALEVFPVLNENQIYLSDVKPYLGKTVVATNKVDFLETFALSELLNDPMGADVVAALEALIGTVYTTKKTDGSFGPLTTIAGTGSLKIVVKTPIAGEVSLEEVLGSLHDQSIDTYLTEKLEESVNIITITQLYGEWVLASGTDTDKVAVSTDSFAQAHPKAYVQGTTLTVVANASPIPTSDYLLDKSGNKVLSANFNNHLTLGKIPGYYNLTAGVDFEVITTGQYVIINWLVAQPTGTPIYASFQTLKTAADYEPKLYFSDTAIIEDYGYPLEGGVFNPLSYAGILCLKGQTTSGGGVWLAPTTSSSDFSYKQVVDKSSNYKINTLITLKQESASLRNYVISNVMANSSVLARNFRTTMIIGDSTADDFTVMAAQSDAFNNRRVTYWANKYLTYTLEDQVLQESVDMRLSGIYAAIYVAGIEGNPKYLWAEPMLRKQLDPSITISTEDAIDESVWTYLGTHNLSWFTMDPLTLVSRVEDIVTTSHNNIIEATRSTTRVNDMISRAMIKNHEAKFIAQLINPGFEQSIKKATENILENFRLKKEIYAWKDVSAVVDSDDPRRINIGYWIRNSFECKYIYNTLSTYIN